MIVQTSIGMHAQGRGLRGSTAGKGEGSGECSLARQPCSSQHEVIGDIEGCAWGQSHSQHAVPTPTHHARNKSRLLPTISYMNLQVFSQAQLQKKLREQIATSLIIQRPGQALWKGSLGLQGPYSRKLEYPRAGTMQIQRFRLCHSNA